jgi:demethylmenaquinone methyltransferase/2-methoxy-6-polyprenyl-1,4-benzoquinol methylase
VERRAERAFVLARLSTAQTWSVPRWKTTWLSMSDPYRRTARFYDALVEPPNVILRRIGLEMCPPREGMKVLEVGCGTGINLRLYENAGCDVFGVDLSPAMLEMARQKLGERADLRLADAAEMPYADDSFDLVTAFLTLHEMPAATRTAVMAEMVRVVNRDGRLLLIDYRSGPIRFPKGWLFKALIVSMELAAGREHFTNYRDFLARQGLPGLISSHGLSVETEKVVSAGNMHAYVARK